MAGGGQIPQGGKGQDQIAQGAESYDECAHAASNLPGGRSLGEVLHSVKERA